MGVSEVWRNGAACCVWESASCACGCFGRTGRTRSSFAHRLGTADACPSATGSEPHAGHGQCECTGCSWRQSSPNRRQPASTSPAPSTGNTLFAVCTRPLGTRWTSSWSSPSSEPPSACQLACATTVADAPASQHSSTTVPRATSYWVHGKSTSEQNRST